MMPNHDQIFSEWAEAYDLIQRSEIDGVGRSPTDVSFYKQQASDATGKILEIGCGTGRVYLDLLEQGEEAYGIDVSRKQLDVLKSNAEHRGLEPRVHRADMRRFDLDETFDLVIVPFNTFVHNTSRTEQLRCLQRVKDHLSDDGKVVLDFPIPKYVRSEDEHVEVAEFTNDGSEFFLVQKYDVDVVEHRLGIERRLFEDREEIARISYEYAQIFLNEFVHLLHRAGFECWNVYGDFEYGALDSDSDSFVWEVYPSTSGSGTSSEVR